MKLAQGLPQQQRTAGAAALFGSCCLCSHPTGAAVKPGCLQSWGKWECATNSPFKKIIQNYLTNKLKSPLVTAAGNCCCCSWGGELGVTLQGEPGARHQFSSREGITACVFPAGSGLPPRSHTAPGGPSLSFSGSHSGRRSSSSS